MVRRRSSISSLKSYALASLTGQVFEWRRQHPDKQVICDSAAILSNLAGGVLDTQFRDVELRASFRQIKPHLSERDLKIFVLMGQARAQPGEVSLVLGIGYLAAAKALERAKGRIRILLIPARNMTA